MTLAALMAQVETEAGRADWLGSLDVRDWLVIGGFVISVSCYASASSGAIGRLERLG